MIPPAIRSHRTIPPKMFTNTPRTFESAIRIPNASLTVSFVAPPPTSRKFAGDPPASFTTSIVAIAKPAPLTMQPIVPSSLT